MCRKTSPSLLCCECEYQKPILDRNNYDVWYLWGNIRTQWRFIAGMSGMMPMGLDYTAVYRIAETMDIDITVALLAKLRALENQALIALSAKEGG